MNTSHTVLEIKAVQTSKELGIIAKEFDIKSISKFKKEDLRTEILAQLKEALKGLPVDGPTAVAEAIDAIETIIPDFFENAEDRSSKVIPHLTRSLGKPLAKGTIVLHADFGRAGTKKARVYIIQKCHGQRNSTLHIFEANDPQTTVNFLNLISADRQLTPEKVPEVEVETPVAEATQEAVTVAETVTEELEDKASE